MMEDKETRNIMGDKLMMGDRERQETRLEIESQEHDWRERQDTRLEIE